MRLLHKPIESRKAKSCLSDLHVHKGRNLKSILSRVSLSIPMKARVFKVALKNLRILRRVRPAEPLRLRWDFAEEPDGTCEQSLDFSHKRK